MKLITRCLFFALLFSLTNCATTEEIWINKDQSIRQEIRMDLGAMLPFMQGLKDEVAGPDNSEDEMDIEVEQGYEKEEKKSSAGEMEDLMAELFTREKVDTTISFKSMMEESMKERGLSEEDFWKELSDKEDSGEMTAAEKKEMETMMKTFMNAEMKIKVDQAKSILQFGFIQNYENGEALNKGASVMEMMEKLNGDDEAAGDPMDEMFQNMLMGANPEYKLSAKEFSIKRPPIDLSDLGEEAQSGIQMVQAMLGGANYTYVIHFPKKVKKVNIKDAEIKGKTVTVKAGMSELFGNGEPFNLVVKYK